MWALVYVHGNFASATLNCCTFCFIDTVYPRTRRMLFSGPPSVIPQWLIKLPRLFMCPQPIHVGGMYAARPTQSDRPLQGGRLIIILLRISQRRLPSPSQKVLHLALPHMPPSNLPLHEVLDVVSDRLLGLLHGGRVHVHMHLLARTLTQAAHLIHTQSQGTPHCEPNVTETERDMEMYHLFWYASKRCLDVDVVSGMEVSSPTSSLYRKSPPTREVVRPSSSMACRVCDAARLQ